MLAGALVFLALILLPAPLLPPHQLAEAVESALGIGWKGAYLLATIGLQSAIYCSLGLLAAHTVTRGETRSGRGVQLAVVPLVTVGTAIIIRSLKQGHIPLWVNAAVPIIACLVGVWLGLGLVFRRPWVVPLLLLPALGGFWWILAGTTSGEVSRRTEAVLHRLVDAGAGLPAGESRFMAVLQTAFAPAAGDSVHTSAIERNRASILALGIAIGEKRLARFVGLDQNSDLVKAVSGRLSGTTLRGREDWPRHFCLSAALAVLEHPLVSDAGGLMKEQLDALTGGSGFSFGDLAADRAGVRFAGAATGSEESARAMRARLLIGADVDAIFPRIADLPENLTVEQFRRDYGGVGTQRYRQVMDEIETRLDSCAMLSYPLSIR